MPRQKIYIDPSRNNRRITTKIWEPNYQDFPAPRPLVLLSHGTGGNRMSLAWIAEALVACGAIVVAPEHYGNSSSTAIPEYFVRYWERPLDLSFVLNHLLAEELKEKIDASRISAIGFSFGGHTVLSLAGAEISIDAMKAAAQLKENQAEFILPEIGDLRPLVANLVPPTIELRDERFKAIVALSPAMGLRFVNADQVKRIIAPTLIIGADNDHIAPLKTNAHRYRDLIQHALYKELSPNIGHYIFLPESRRSKDSIYFNDAPGVDRHQIHQQVIQNIINFLNQQHLL